jgi:magnesium-transporting ATPase (P-type)
MVAGDRQRRTPPPHALQVSELAHVLGSDPTVGLLLAEVAARLARYGPNRPRPPHRPRYLRLLVDEFVDPLVLLLVLATVVAVAIGDIVEGVAIAAVLAINATLGFWHRLAAERALLALASSFAKQAVVLRGGSAVAVAAENVAPGDVLLLAAGDQVAADGRIVEEHGLEVDESALTGESLPVGKQTAAVPGETPLAERASMAYAGSTVTRGRAHVVVCTTGGTTEFRLIETLPTATKPPATPLTRRLSRLARQMVLAGIVLTGLLTASMLLRGEPMHEAFLVGVAVAVAAVPEGLAATVTPRSRSERARSRGVARSSGSSRRSRHSARRR